MTEYGKVRQSRSLLGADEEQEAKSLSLPNHLLCCVWSVLHYSHIKLGQLIVCYSYLNNRYKIVSHNHPPSFSPNRHQKHMH